MSEPRDPFEAADPFTILDPVGLLDEVQEDQEAWIRLGIAKGWCGPPICGTHEGWMNEAEYELFDEGEDPCIAILRLYEVGESPHLRPDVEVVSLAEVEVLDPDTGC